MPSFDDLVPVMERVQIAVRRVIPNTGCELASALLARELREAGSPAAFVRGHYVAPGDSIGDHNLHAWVRLHDLVLDPTRDQFSESPFTEAYRGEYVSDLDGPPPDLDTHIYTLLNLQLPYQREAVLALVADFRLDPLELDKHDAIGWRLRPAVAACQDSCGP